MSRRLNATVAFWIWEPPCPSRAGSTGWLPDKPGTSKQETQGFKRGLNHTFCYKKLIHYGRKAHGNPKRGRRRPCICTSGSQYSAREGCLLVQISYPLKVHSSV
ncbi:hypothetical protein CGRA01v4_06530 [Colletotrichum graminicola]|nr:hypothetical protein CGRA01v4_06530 [Colletotrichum graminicola]